MPARMPRPSAADGPLVAADMPSTISGAVCAGSRTKPAPTTIAAASTRLIEDRKGNHRQRHQDHRPEQQLGEEMLAMLDRREKAGISVGQRDERRAQDR